MTRDPVLFILQLSVTQATKYLVFSMQHMGFDELLHMLPIAVKDGTNHTLETALLNKAKSIVSEYFEGTEAYEAIEERVDILVPMRFIVSISSNNGDAQAGVKVCHLFRLIKSDAPEDQIVDTVEVFDRRVLVLPINENELTHHNFYSCGCLYLFNKENPLV